MILNQNAGPLYHAVLGVADSAATDDLACFFRAGFEGEFFFIKIDELTDSYQYGPQIYN